ncbi:S8 family serine peptidase [Alteromonas sp. 5E99-2]|uniref:S8 family serine peptidase n=1 Tax=Alteromonas sp. 5E99-2 TaxID=2817683 RepID=UPI001A990E22|nr:S8 family serine peptidase [Alteromonas sp. 5E99-2]MBO1256290.1 S8 family serine peptidase [Alteromonas sp. 5E99-2]
MKRKTIVNSVMLACMGLSGVTAAQDYLVNVDTSKLKAVGPAPVVPSASNVYIIQLKGATGIAKASELGELTPSNQLVAKNGNNYNAKTPALTAYIQSMQEAQDEVASEIGVNDILYKYTHTFNGFSAKLTDSQLDAVRSHPEVSAVYKDELQKPQTANTPAFLGLTGPNGQHTLGLKGEDVIIGVLDSGIWPENPAFSEDSSVAELAYGPAPESWAGECNVGSVGSFVNESGVEVYNDETAPVDEFECNNKLIGARYFGSAFSSSLEIQFGLGEFASPRDADGHGSHTTSTAGGNEGITAVLSGTEVGTISGIAPRARLATYKVCWNADYVNPDGDDEAGCFFGDSMAAIDQAVVDGVDVLNYSIGNSQAINSPVYNASLAAAEAGVLFAGSAGNSGPTADTVSNIAPWIATVAASTYDGESVLIGSELEVSAGDLPTSGLFSIPGAITTDIPEAGFSGDLGLAEPLEACDPLTSDLTGQIALIARGTCAFSTKILNAQAAGAVGVVVYSDDRPAIAMGGDATGITVPGVMVGNSDGLELVSTLSEVSTLVNMTTDGISMPTTEVGNIMANFSSRGVNTQTGDILKPDITAPGVRILAGNTPDQLDTGTHTDGELFQYLQGTSMSSPHIAGMAALLVGQHPNWSPAAIKSALMTSARQDIVKEDGFTQADPFDFGAGHADPVSAMNPGLVYEANFGDYLGFLCGQNEENLVLSLQGSGDDAASCDELSERGFATDASQLNYPSIAIAELEGTETIFRTVTDVSGDGGVYDVIVEAPLGIDVTVATFDSEGNETDSNQVEVAAGGTASYALTFTTTESIVPDEWVFGSVTLSGDEDVRSPIAIRPLANVTIDVPESLSLQLNRGRATFFVETSYTGSFAMETKGLTPATGIAGTEVNRNGAAFDFGAGLNTSTFLSIPEGTSVARFALSDELVAEDGADLDLYVYSCEDFSCTLAGQSATVGTSNEDVLLVNPVARFDDAAGDLYVLFVHAADTGVDASGDANDSVDYIVPNWIVESADSSTVATASSLAINGRFQNISLRTRGLDSSLLYMGSIDFIDASGESQGTTVLEVQP